MSKDGLRIPRAVKFSQPIYSELSSNGSVGRYLGTDGN
jgi:hypothetical protein